METAIGTTAFSAWSRKTRATTKPVVLTTTAASGARRRQASGAITMASPASSTNREGARYAGFENLKTSIAGLDVITATPKAAAASAASAARGLASKRAQTRLIRLHTAQTYRAATALPSSLRPTRIRLKADPGVAARRM